MRKIQVSKVEAGDWVAEGMGDKMFLTARQALKMYQEIADLKAERDSLLKDKDRLDSGRIMTSERDEFGDEYTCDRRGLDLRAMIDAAIAEKEKA